MNSNKDKSAIRRKKDHIALALESQTGKNKRDTRFNYEPAINHMASEKSNISLNFLGAELEAPIWVSSMTGGTEKAAHINQNLARACNEFGLGMGLGSCRQLLKSDEFFLDFDVREIIGIQPLYANLGIAQIIEIVRNEDFQTIINLISKLKADGLFIHINPMQEWMQPEGDMIDLNPLDCIQKVIDNVKTKIVIKEVGQGFGPESLKAMLSMDIAGIELAGFGGTNFTKLEALRREENYHSEFINLGHTAEEMVQFINDISRDNIKAKMKHIIISGGVKDYLSGYYLNKKCELNSVYGQASSFLNHALGNYSDLAKYVEAQIEGYKMAAQYLTVAR
ncbi:MAG: isopentenyl-diphosphate delta-isomerase [Saprospiraceae bacterium]|nr:isopentenyl-diphosphate delta-isomerase [Saprospiraceae bacterium]